MTRTWIGRIAIAVLALLLLLLVAAVVLVATFDANRYKSLAIDWMRTERQRQLVIDGPIELSLFPRLALKVSKLRLSESGRSDEFVSLDEAALAVQVLPLLNRRLVIDRVSARGVRAVYLRNAQGLRNIDDLVSADPDLTPAGRGGADAPSLRFDISGVQLDDLQLRVRDEKADVAGDIAIASFTSGRLAPRSATSIALRATARLTRPHAATLAVDGRTTAVLDLGKNAISMTDMKLSVEASSAAVVKASLVLTGALAWDGRAILAGPLHVALANASFAAGTLQPSTLDVRRAAFSPGDERLELESLRVALAGRHGAQAFELGLEWPQLTVAGQRLTGGPLTGQVKLAGPTTLAGRFATAAPNGSFKALRLPGVVATIDGSTGGRKIAGTLKADAVVDVGNQAVAFERLDVRTTLDDPGLPALQLSVAGNAGLDATALSARWTLDGSLNANRFESTGRASFAAAVPQVKADARFDRLDLDKLWPPDPPGTAPTGASGPTRGGDPAVRLDALRSVDGQFKLGAGLLVVRQVRVADARVEASLAAGQLRVDRLSGKSWSGQVRASGSADAGSRRIAVKLDADNVDIHALLKDVAGKDLLEGTGHVAADLVTGGATLGALRAGLDGTVSLQLRDGAVRGFNLARTFRQAQAALSLKQDNVSQASATEKTDFTELSASARIKDGVAVSDDLSVKSPFLRIGGSGRFDIGRGRIDYVARATVTDAASGQGGADLKALRGVTVPVLLSGPFDAIDWKIQWSEVAAKAIENQLKDQLKDRLAERLGVELGAPKAGEGDAAGQASPPRGKDLLRDALKGLLR